MKNIKFIIPDDYQNPSEVIHEILRLVKTKKYNFIEFQSQSPADNFSVVAYSKETITKSQVKKEFQKNLDN